MKFFRDDFHDDFRDYFFSNWIAPLFSTGQTAQSLTCSFMEKPHTGLDECPRILLSCFRARNSGRRRHQDRGQFRAVQNCEWGPTCRFGGDCDSWWLQKIVHNNHTDIAQHWDSGRQPLVAGQQEWNWQGQQEFCGWWGWHGEQWQGEAVIQVPRKCEMWNCAKLCPMFPVQSCLKTIQSSPLIWSLDVWSTRLYGQLNS